MEDRNVRIEIDRAAGLCESEAEIDILDLQEILLVHAADREIRLTLLAKAGPSVDRDRRHVFRARIAVQVEAAEIGVARRQGVELRRLNEGAPRRQRRAA